MAEAETRIAFIPQIEGIPYYVAMRQGAEKAAAEFGVTYVQEGPASTNAADQLRIFDSFVNQGFEVIAISPLDEESLKPAIARAKEKGIVVLTSDADAPNSGRSFFVAQALDRDLGYTLLDETVKRVGDTGKIAIVSDSPTIQSMQNWIAAIKERAASTYPKIEIVSVDHTDGTAARAYQFATDAMTRNPDLKAVLGMASTTCPGIAQAVEAAGRDRPGALDRLLLAQHRPRLHQERRDAVLRALEPGRSRLPDGLGRQAPGRGRQGRRAADGAGDEGARAVSAREPDHPARRAHRVHAGERRSVRLLTQELARIPT